MWRVIGNTLGEKLKFAADILQAINIFVSIVAGLIVWTEFDPFAGILAMIFFMFVSWCVKLIMYALSQLSTYCDTETKRLHQLEAQLGTGQSDQSEAEDIQSK